MLPPVCTVTAPTGREEILSVLGSFSSSDPGLFARQFGLCVSSTRPTLELKPESLELRPDLTSACVCKEAHPFGYQPRPGQDFCFTGEDSYDFMTNLSFACNSPCPPLAADAAAAVAAAAEGCGFMSGALWRRLGSLHPRLSRSSAVQLRLGGFKGMLALHPAFPKEALSRGVHVLLHHSMKKLDSQLTVILILDTLQVPLQALERLQQRMLDLLKGPARQRGELLALMHWAETDQDSRGPAEKIVFELLRSSAFSLKEPFLHDVAAAAETQCLHLLKNKARIFVEVNSRLRCMLADTSLTLSSRWRRLGGTRAILKRILFSRETAKTIATKADSYLRISTSNTNTSRKSSSSSSSSSSKDRFADVARPLPCDVEGPYADYGARNSEILSGVVAVVKSPCMHPGDLQLCYAVGIEQLPLDSPLRSPLERTPSQDDPDPAAFAFRDLLVFPPPPVGWFKNRQGTRWPPLNPRHPGVLSKEPQVEYHFRDVPNMLSGGDLDGDRYWVLWEPAIVGPLLERWQQGLAPPPFAAHEPNSAAHTAINSDAAAAAAAAGSSSDSSSETDASDSERQSNTSDDDDAAAADEEAAGRAAGEEAAGVKALALEQTESSEGEATTTAASLLPLSSTPTASSRDSDGLLRLQQAAATEGEKEPALNPLQVTAYWEGVQHKEEASLLFTGETCVHCLRIEVTLPGALVVGGPSLPGASTLEANRKPTLRALLFSVHPASHACPQSSRSLQSHRSPFIFSPPTRLPPGSAWFSGGNSTVYIHCAAEPDNLENTCRSSAAPAAAGAEVCGSVAALRLNAAALNAAVRLLLLSIHSWKSAAKKISQPPRAAAAAAASAAAAAAAAAIFALAACC
ncbi:hypothetical protein Emag_004619 [Eimeria magna]